MTPHAMFYVSYTVQAWKDDVCLFETDCELGIYYELPDGPDGLIDWDVVEFHFTDKKDGKPVYTKINRHEPLFHVLYKDLDNEYLGERIREALADSGIVNLYGTLSYA